MNDAKEVENVIHLINTLNDHTWSTRIQAADALIRLGTPVVKPLIAKIRQNFFSAFTLPEAIRVLGGVGDVQATDLLIEILNSEYVQSAMEAAKGLGNIGEQRAIPSLINAFQHSWEDEEETIITRQEISNALAAIGEAAIFPLILALQSGNNMVRSGIIHTLGQLRDVRAINPLVEILRDEDQQIRADAVEALGYIGDPQALESLIALLKDKNAYIRLRVCYALGDIGGVFVFDPLISALHDPEPDVRSAAVFNLGRAQERLASDQRQHPEPEEKYVLDLLLEALKDPAGSVRAAAAHTLGLIGNESTLPTLLWVQQNDTGSAGANSVKDIAALAIQHLQERYQKDK